MRDDLKSRARARRARDGRNRGHGEPPAPSPTRITVRIHQPCLRPLRETVRHRPLDGLDRRPLGQRTRRELLRHPREGAPPSRALPTREEADSGSSGTSNASTTRAAGTPASACSARSPTNSNTNRRPSRPNPQVSTETGYLPQRCDDPRCQQVGAATFDQATGHWCSPGSTRPGHVLHLLSVGARGARTFPAGGGPVPLARRSTLRRLVGRILPAMVAQ